MEKVWDEGKRDDKMKNKDRDVGKGTDEIGHAAASGAMPEITPRKSSDVKYTGALVVEACDDGAKDRQDIIKRKGNKGRCTTKVIFVDDFRRRLKSDTVRD